MEDQQGEYVEHQYMCSECQQLFNTLEEVLVHQQVHVGGEAEESEVQPPQEEPSPEESQYQCLECGALLRNADELLLHQELHMREAGVETEHGLSEVTEVDPGAGPGEESIPIQYQCLECLALFNTAELWLAHRHTHSKSNTHSVMSETEYVLQADGSVTPLVSVQNLVLDEQKAGEILSLAQALAREQSAPAPRATPLPASATLRLQICSAQALADGSTHPTLRRAKLLPPLLSPDPLHLGNGGARSEEEKDGGEEVLYLHPYECSECSLLFATPEDFLQHQGEHFLPQEKEREEEGMMEVYGEDRGGRGGETERFGMAEEKGSDRNRAVTGRRVYSARAVTTATATPVNLECAECHRTFTSANRLAAHKRVHEHGTHECPECEKVFKKAGSLQTHLRTHTGEARYLCVDCGHSFTTEMTLVIHRKSHTAEPLHRCPFCPKTFTNMTKFLYHRRTHTTRTPVGPVSTLGLTARRPVEPTLSILQRAREREATGRRERVTGCLIPPVTEGDVGASDPCSAVLPVPTVTSDPQVIVTVTEHAVGVEQNGLDAGKFTAGTANPMAIKEETSVKAPDPSTPSVTSELSPAGAQVSLEEANGGGAFPCQSCEKTFPSQLRLLRHRHTVHACEHRFKCGVCGKPFKKQIHVRNHLRTHTGERPFQCSVCGKTFSSHANLSRHTHTHTGARPYRCDICHKAFTQSSNLRQHRLLHANAPPSACPDCPASFLRPAKLKAHRFLRHDGPAPYSCPHCTQGFLRKRQRDLHCLEEHPTLPHPLTGHAHQPDAAESAGADGEAGGAPGAKTISLDCGICGKRLNSAANLRLHQLLHGNRPGRPRGSASSSGGGRSHSCSVCGKAFVSASSVRLHQRVHTGERPFPCGVCGKRFRQNTHLREHLRTHSGERPFRCEFCGKGFVQSMHLSEHRRTHTGEKPHPCSVCGKAFRTVSNLRNHRKIHARNQVTTESQQVAVAMDTGGPAVTVVEAGVADSAAAVPTFCQQEALGQQVIQIQTSDLQQGAPTLMCNAFGEPIAIIEAGGDVAEAIQLFHTALETSVNMEAVALDNQLQLL
ncbi:zinc finger protein 574 [Chanos chanos]|uniref:Zinc finger protein 574 n=1 Tax=Chanos chanos TaxID=29144 RepID=A0A6J2WC71_CHACN|nr:zinc finger protein 574 [Chanos chanos]